MGSEGEGKEGEEWEEEEKSLARKNCEESSDQDGAEKKQTRTHRGHYLAHLSLATRPRL